MKKIWTLLLFVLIASIASGQQQTEYNRKGDAAMMRSDYRDAKMWYEEGVSYCNTYSIEKLTEIWHKSEEMHPSMRSLMSKCLDCLTAKGAENDTTAIKMLVVYYKEGIGTLQSNNLASYWEQRIQTLSGRNTAEQSYPTNHSHFFIGYNYSTVAPVGLTIGRMGQHLGWYVRLKSNFSFESSTAECNNQEVINFPDANSYYKFDKKKVNSHSGTAGVLIKCTPSIYTSVGLGYSTRDLLWHYTSYSHSNDNRNNSEWCKNTEASYNGLVMEADVMFKFGSMFVSAGGGTTSFKYVDLNAGIGVFF